MRRRFREGDPTEACIKRISAVTRLLHADNIIARLSFKLDETAKQQPNHSLVADLCDPTRQTWQN